MSKSKKKKAKNHGLRPRATRTDNDSGLIVHNKIETELLAISRRQLELAEKQLEAGQTQVRLNAQQLDLGRRQFRLNWWQSLFTVVGLALTVTVPLVLREESRQQTLSDSRNSVNSRRSVQVKILNPTNNATFTYGSSVTLVAQATSSRGEITRVSFNANSTALAIGSESAAGKGIDKYALIWSTKSRSASLA